MPSTRSSSRSLPVRTLGGVLARWLLAGILAGVAVALLCMGWVALVSGSASGLGPTTRFAAALGGALGAGVGLPTGIVWVALARTGPRGWRTARLTAALSAGTLVLVASFALLHGAGVFALVVALGSGLAAYRWGPLLGVCRPADPQSSSVASTSLM